MKAIEASGIELITEVDMVLEIRRISPARLIEGGAAMLQAEKQNHQKVIEGNKLNIPFVKYIPRELIVSYVILAKANIHDEQSPCEIKIRNAPCQPQVVFDIIPAVARPMWATEE